MSKPPWLPGIAQIELLQVRTTAGEHFGLGSVAAKIIDAPLISQTVYRSGDLGIEFD